MAYQRFVSVAGGVLLAAGSANAQTVERRLDVAASTDVVFDDNVARATEARARASRLEPEDVVFRPALNVDAVLPFGRNSLTLSGSLGYDIHARNTRLNRERLFLDSTLAVRFASCDGTLSTDFTRQQSDLANLAFTPGLARDEISNTETLTSVTGTLACGDRIGFRPTVSVTQSFGRNTNDFYQYSDFNSTGVSAGVEYSGPAFGTLTVFGSYSNSSYPNREFLFGPGDDGFETKSISARLQREIGARLSGSIEAGYTNVSSKREGGGEGFSGLTASANLVGRVTDRLQLSGRLARSVSASNVLGADYVINRVIALDANFALSERMNVTAGASWNARDLRGQVTLLPTIGSDETSLVHAGVQYGWNQRLRSTVRFERAHRDAQFEEFNYTSNRIILSLRAGF